MSAVEERPYQTNAITEARAAFKRGCHAPLIVAPTGSGKTVIAARAILLAVKRNPLVRVAFFGHRRELRDQAARTLRRMGLDVEARGERKACLIQVTGPQIVISRRQMPEADLAVFDEAHHYVADEWGQIPIGYLKAGARILGFTATPERGDGVGLGELFDALVVAAQIADLTEAGHLVPCEVIYPRTMSMLAIEPWQAYKRFADGKSAVVFAPHVKAAEDFAEAFRSNGVPAAVVHGNLEDDDRDGALARFAAGKIKVLVNVMVLTEGWDCPRAEVCILARRVASPSLYLQMVGRVLRPFEGKTSALMIDLSGNRELHGDPDELRDWHLEGAACTRRNGVADGIRHCKSCKAEIPPGADACPECLRALPELETPRAENVELVKAERDERRREKQEAISRLEEDRRIGILATLYVKAISGRKKRGSAHYAYKGMTGRFPDAALSARAWHEALDRVAASKGDAFVPPEEYLDQS